MEKDNVKIPSYDEIMKKAENQANQDMAHTNGRSVEGDCGFGNSKCQPPIGSALGTAMATARNLDDQIAKLFSILEPIIGECDKRPGNEVEILVISPLGIEINNITNMLLHSTCIIYDILNSVEI